MNDFSSASNDYASIKAVGIGCHHVSEYALEKQQKAILGARGMKLSKRIKGGNYCA